MAIGYEIRYGGFGVEDFANLLLAESMHGCTFTLGTLEIKSFS